MKSGEIRPLAGEGTGGATLARKDDRLYFQEGRNYFWTHVSSAFASHGAAGHIASFPEDVEEVIGLTLDADEETLYAGAVFEKDKRWGVLALDIATGEWRRVVEVDFRVGHVQANPFVPGLVLFCWETGGDSPQRMWVAKTDGSKPVPFYKETYEEWVTHEVWWGPSRVIFTISPYDEEHKKKPHGVVSADLPDGPLNVHSQFHAWHTHGSPDGKWAVADDFARNIWLIRIESGQRRLLTQGHRALKIDNHPHPTFTPDGKSVVFTSSKNGSEDIFMVDIPEWESLPKP
jgi:oligogalacturonide lyase